MAQGCGGHDGACNLGHGRGSRDCKREYDRVLRACRSISLVSANGEGRRHRRSRASVISIRR
jgi:hypothetical protein